ncbi:MAG TPA: glycosyltransferase family 39 protein, partial [Anaerolineae bacterium]
MSVLIFYMPPYYRSFVGDDYVQLDYVSDFLQRPFTAYQVFNPFQLLWYYRPLQNLWFLANRLVFGLNPFGYYYLQICLHLVAVALVYRVARQLGIGTVAALAGAALFAIRSHHADVVTWISSVAIILTAIFALLALSSYLSYVRRPARWPLLLLTTVFFLLGLLSHEEGFLLPPLLLFWSLGIGDWRLKERQEMGSFLLMFLVMVAYLPIQFMRDNAV